MLVIPKTSRLIEEVMHSHFEPLFIYIMNNRFGCIGATIIFLTTMLHDEKNVHWLRSIFQLSALSLQSYV